MGTVRGVAPSKPGGEERTNADFGFDEGASRCRDCGCSRGRAFASDGRGDGGAQRGLRGQRRGDDEHGCLFELDGNVQNDPPASAGNNAGFDWANGDWRAGRLRRERDVQTLVDPQLLKADFVADYTQPDTSYFASSTKDIDDVSTWQCGSVNNPTPKDEILNAYATLWSPTSGADAGHAIVYAAAERLANNGNAFMGFWLFQGRVACNSPTGRPRPSSVRTTSATS